jgi:hypothetical protein
MTAGPVHVVGGSIGALVAADALARRGRGVVLHLPDRGVGAGFLPLEVDGVALDVGARLIELAYDGCTGDPPALDEYAPGPHGHRPYLALIDALVRELAGDDLYAVPSPQLSIGGRVAGDVVFAGDLRGLPTLFAADVLARIETEAACAVLAEGSAGLFAGERRAELWSTTFADASRRHTGATFHGLVTEALAAKILPGGTASVIAALHRRIWLPLFHPSTVRDAAAGAPSYVPDRPMYSLAGGGMGEVVRRLIERVTCAGTVTVSRPGALVGLERAGGSTRLRFERGLDVLAERPLIGASAGEVFSAAGIAHLAAKTWATIAWVDVDVPAVPDDLSVRFVADPQIPMYRVTRNSMDAPDGSRVLACEMAHWVPADEAERAAAVALDDAGIAPRDRVRPRHSVRVPASTVPDAGNRATFEAAREDLDAKGLDIEIVGGAVGFGVDSFNEQVVQGLRAAQLSER